MSNLQCHNKIYNQIKMFTNEGVSKLKDDNDKLFKLNLEPNQQILSVIPKKSIIINKILNGGLPPFKSYIDKEGTVSRNVIEKRILNLNANNLEQIRNIFVEEAIKLFQRKDRDTGSSEVQSKYYF